MMKAADNLKTQQKQLESERNNVLSKRLPQCPNIDGIEDKGLLPFSCCKRYILHIITIYITGQLEKIYQDLFAKMVQLEEEKYDINHVVSSKDSEVSS